MLRRTFTFPMLVVGLAMLANTATAADDKAPTAKPGELLTIRSKLEPCVMASTIDFRKATGLPFSSLLSLGSRIQQAKEAADPVCLANCARELAVAEQVSGKNAAITAKSILDEAVSLAEIRGDSTELKAVALLAGDAKIKGKLDSLATEAAEREANARKAAKEGEASREIHGSLTVCNHTDECLNIYVGGRFVGEVHAGESASFHVHDHNHYTQLSAYCVEDGELVKSAYSHGHNHNVSWEIDPS